MRLALKRGTGARGPLSKNLSHIQIRFAVARAIRLDYLTAINLDGPPRRIYQVASRRWHVGVYRLLRMRDFGQGSRLRISSASLLSTALTDD
jgi:hypothetical protein